MASWVQHLQVADLLAACRRRRIARKDQRPARDGPSAGHRQPRGGQEGRRSRHQGCRALVEPIPSGSNIRTIPYDDGNKGGRTKNVEENRQ